MIQRTQQSSENRKHYGHFLFKFSNSQRSLEELRKIVRAYEFCFQCQKLFFDHSFASTGFGPGGGNGLVHNFSPILMLPQPFKNYVRVK